MSGARPEGDAVTDGRSLQPQRARIRVSISVGSSSQQHSSADQAASIAIDRLFAD